MKAKERRQLDREEQLRDVTNEEFEEERLRREEAKKEEKKRRRIRYEREIL